MKNLKKISKEKLKSINGGINECPKGMNVAYCPDNRVPQCYFHHNTLDCRS
ncbi:bacteriocin-like protein [Chryseobacterium ureilyticum]